MSPCRVQSSPSSCLVNCHAKFGSFVKQFEHVWNSDVNKDFGSKDLALYFKDCQTL